MPTTWTELAVVAAAAVLAIGILGGVGAHGGAAKLSPDRGSWVLIAHPPRPHETIGDPICKHGWTRTVRPPTTYTNELKVEQMEAYHRAGSTSDYQEDHLLSLELGGEPTDPRNLWPEPVVRAEDVDTSVEDALN